MHLCYSRLQIERVQKTETITIVWKQIQCQEICADSKLRKVFRDVDAQMWQMVLNWRPMLRVGISARSHSQTV